MTVPPVLVMSVSVLTVVFGILVKIIGIPDQIRQNYRRKSTEGISFLNTIIGLLAYVFWTVHGIFEHDPVLIFGQSLGIVTTAILAFQFFVYQKR